MQIQKLRLQHGWSQEQLAELSGLSTRTIQRIEGGQTPSPETMKALGAVFGINFLDQPVQTATETTMTALEFQNNDEFIAFIHVRKFRGFYINLSIYLAVMTVIIAVNLISTPIFLWFF